MQKTYKPAYYCDIASHEDRERIIRGAEKLGCNRAHFAPTGWVFFVPKGPPSDPFAHRHALREIMAQYGMVEVDHCYSQRLRHDEDSALHHASGHLQRLYVMFGYPA